MKNSSSQQSKNPPDLEENTSSSLSEVEALQKDLSEKEEQLLRALADLQNVRRRWKDDASRLPVLGMEKVILAILPSLDHFELAMKNTTEEGDEWKKGIEAIFIGLFSALSTIGVEKIEATDIPVDPNFHEVIMADEEKPEGMVCEILQSGYRLGEKVIRPAKIKAGSKTPES
ncbi:nucleotide exchange factor GrpE [Candidatus Peregrinibacteria bacterium]|nr:MAG: nucleotide exchange factor GrpE [Candidatus Peregrinibacteria bacterium]